MNQAVYEKNLLVLEKNYKVIFDIVKNYEENEEKVYIDESVNGEAIIAVNKSNHLYYLNSRYNDDEFSENWVKQFEENKYQEVFFVFGLSNFNCVSKLVKAVKNSNLVMLYEPDIEIFIRALYITDITEIISNKKVVLCIKGINDKCFQDFLLFLLDYSNMKLLNFNCMLNYEILYANECKEVIDAIKARCEGIVALRNTNIMFSQEFIDNALSNCYDMIEQYSLNQLRDSFYRMDLLQEIPAIIVSAGPSLNKNVRDLKLAENKAIIIAVDTALKTLLNNDIKPDLVVTVDPHKPPTLFAHKDFYDIPLIECSTSNNKIRHIHNGKRIYFFNGNNYMMHLYKNTRKEDLQCLETGGSVANNAFSLAQVLGFSKIVLIGQDLAYPNKKGHTTEAYMGSENEIDSKNDKYFEVEDVYGNRVLTEGNMNLYRSWFETQILRYPYLKVIDATEGGAKINGTEILTLKETIERECKKEVDKSFINDIEKICSADEVRLLKQEINGLEDRLDEIKKELKNGIRKYEKLEELFRKNKAGTKEFKTVMGEIDKVTKLIEEEPVMGFVSAYNKEDEYDVLGEVYEVKNELKDEIRDIVDKGTKMLNSYIKAIDLFVKDLRERNRFDSEKYCSMVEEVKKNIAGLARKIEANDSVKINNFMIVLYKGLLNIIDVQSRINSENYEKSIEAFKNVIDAYNNRDYYKVLEIFNTDIVENITNPCRILGEKV